MAADLPDIDYEDMLACLISSGLRITDSEGEEHDEEYVASCLRRAVRDARRVATPAPTGEARIRAACSRVLAGDGSRSGEAKSLARTIIAMLEDKP